VSDHIELIVTYAGIDFEVTGEYEKYVPGRAYLPNGDPGDAPEGGGIDEMDILHDGVSVYEMLNEETIARIKEAAEAAATNQ